MKIKKVRRLLASQNLETALSTLKTAIDKHKKQEQELVSLVLRYQRLVDQREKLHNTRKG